MLRVGTLLPKLRDGSNSDITAHGRRAAEKEDLHDDFSDAPWRGCDVSCLYYFQPWSDVMGLQRHGKHISSMGLGRHHQCWGVGFEDADSGRKQGYKGHRDILAMGRAAASVVKRQQSRSIAFITGICPSVSLVSGQGRLIKVERSQAMLKIFEVATKGLSEEKPCIKAY